MRTQWKKIIIGVASLVGVACAVFGFAAWHLYREAEQTAAKMYLDPDKPMYVSQDPQVMAKKAQNTSVSSEGPKPLTILLLGVDERNQDQGRTDTIMVASVNPARKSMLLFNIPRDTRTAIIGRNRTDKINHAYAYGGLSSSIQSVEHFLDYPIDYYIKVNMEAFVRTIDLVGGIEISNPFAFTYSGHTFDKGNIELNGREALLYSRMRFEDPRGDLGRNERQRAIIGQLLEKSGNIKILTQIEKLLEEAGNSVQTNLKFGDMRTLLTEYRSGIKNVQTTEIRGAGEKLDGIWYYRVEEAERKRLHDLLKNHQNGA
ncbi:LCP family protein [Paenibacillus methanolicus]|uniref:LCP family protein required for cell wall assembly n=1 Tax=Paenibacillus methanolicus TaxID=582686 RepID=A0A5S5BVT2_9BACL|nr:LCP family protein [Paenibacillus methanolicus]TYP70292.1 LCP family protein required for cell wall assembly [Paenibacillus methanolicus]